MTKFDNKHFRKFPFTDEQNDQFFQNALRDLKISKEDGIPEVRFTYKVRSIPGHHIAVISKMSEILKDDDVNIIGNRMRMKRNKDLYDGGDIISAKEADECLKFVEEAIKKIGGSFKAG